MTNTLAVRFWKKVCRTADCWLWTGSKNAKGYGRLSPGRERAAPLRAHRVSWELHYGPIPVGLFVLHHCDNPSCVNPAHLFLGTARDNTHDMVRKGRLKSPWVRERSAA